jgi:hypothetical protein
MFGMFLAGISFVVSSALLLFWISLGGEPTSVSGFVRDTCC